MSKKILVVDDEEMGLRMAEFILQKEYQVEKATSGAECLEKLGQDRFDLVLLDVEMPVMNGFETLEKIRNMSSCKDQKVVFLSADDDAKSKEKACALGALGFVRKPILPQDLQNFVAEILV